MAASLLAKEFKQTLSRDQGEELRELTFEGAGDAVSLADSLGFSGGMADVLVDGYQGLLRARPPED